jgi:hypothetical protein
MALTLEQIRQYKQDTADRINKAAKAKSYSIEGRSTTNHDLADLQKLYNFWCKEERKAASGGKIRTKGAVIVYDK